MDEMIDYRFTEMEKRTDGLNSRTFEHANRLTAVETDHKGIKDDMARVENKIDGVNNWLKGIATGLILALIGLLLNLLIPGRTAHP